MTPDEIQAKLSAPFPADVIGWKAQTVKNNRAMAVAYIDARDVENRLDEVVGVHNWQDEYTQLPGGSVLCRLSVRIGGEWIAKSDIGGESEQPDQGDRAKAAVSDALKRAAVKFGVGRYLYSLPTQWCDYDPVKKQITNPPQLPSKFLPTRTSTPKAAPAPAPKPEPAPTPAPAAVDLPKPRPNPEAQAARVENPQPADDPLTDITALLALLYAKGWDWAGLIRSLNEKFSTNYSVTGTKWADVAEGYRAATVQVLRGMPDEDTAPYLEKLVERSAEADGIDTATAFTRYAIYAKLPDSVVRPEHMTPEQLQAACRAFKDKLTKIAKGASK